MNRLRRVSQHGLETRRHAVHVAKMAVGENGDVHGHVGCGPSVAGRATRYDSRIRSRSEWSDVLPENVVCTCGSSFTWPPPSSCWMWSRRLGALDECGGTWQAHYSCSLRVECEDRVLFERRRRKSLRSETVSPNSASERSTLLRPSRSFLRSEFVRGFSRKLERGRRPLRPAFNRGRDDEIRPTALPQRFRLVGERLHRTLDSMPIPVTNR